MQLFLFVVNGTPGYRTSLSDAQACLEEHLRDLSDVSDVWWDDHDPLYARKYMYGSSHEETAVEDAEVNFETTEQLIWPVEVPELPEQPAKEDRYSLFPGGAEMTMSVVTGTGKIQMIRRVPETDWSEDRLKPHLITTFAVRAGRALADEIKKEPT